MTYFERLAQRALGVEPTTSVVPRATTWYGGAGFDDVAPVEAARPLEVSRSVERQPAPTRVATSEPVLPGTPRPVAPHAPRDAESAPHTSVSPIPPAKPGELVGHAPTLARVAEQAALPPGPRVSPPRSTDTTDTIAPTSRAPDAPPRPESRVALEPKSAMVERSALGTRTVAPPTRNPLATFETPTSARGDTIRVHIGRVDVRAVFPATPPAPAAKPAARPNLTLEKFLSRGREGER